MYWEEILANLPEFRDYFAKVSEDLEAGTSAWSQIQSQGMASQHTNLLLLSYHLV